jgi:cytochrome c biogenesis protein CcdA
MINYLFLFLTFAAAATTVYYGFYYEASIPGATYHQNYAWLSILAAIIFGGLFFASRVNRSRSEANILFGGR